MQKVSTYGDDTIASAMAMTAAFITDEAQIKKVTEAAMDLSAATGKDLVSSTEAITKSIASGNNALARQGLYMEKTTDQTKRLDSLVRSITQAYGGMAQAQALTDTGKIKQADEAINNYEASMGKRLIPTIANLKTVQVEVFKTLDQGVADAVQLPKTLEALWNSITGKKEDFEIADIYIRDAQAAGEGGIDVLEYYISEAKKKQQEMGDWVTDLSQRYFNAVEKGNYNEQRSTYEKLNSAKAQYSELQSVIDKLTEAQNKLVEAQVGKGVKVKGTVDWEAIQAENDKKRKEELDKWVKFSMQINEIERAWGVADAQARWEARERGFEVEFNMFSDYSDKAKALEQENLSNREAMRKDFEARVDDLAGSTLKGRTDLIARSFQDEVVLYKFMLDQKIINEQEFNDTVASMKKEANKAYYDEWVTAITETTDTITGILSTAANMWQSINSAVIEKQMSDLDEETEARTKAAKKNIVNKRKLEDELDKINKQAEQKRKEIAKREKQIAMAMAIINTAQGVTKALSDYGFPLGVIMGALVGIAGAIQVGVIASQAFAQGGIVEANGAPATGDKVRANVNPGEMILTKQQQRNLFALANTPQNGGSNVVLHENIVVNGNMDSNALSELRAHREEWLDMLRESNKTLQYRGYTYAT